LISEARNVLRKLREEQVRDGELEVKLWEEALMDCCHKLGSERKFFRFFFPLLGVGLFILHKFLVENQFYLSMQYNICRDDHSVYH
jgi:hypothetical protein